ncbi:cysteine hydrolase family protein [Patulibacter sp.]|uniref:cysteine hydrolase family protein n=1 Tax=Patulibacter sp. TaxID=1912859 RepID=UPI0027164379|nr:cysteine hydrolase family protein [Patulibacter sp.]MDO9407441.1 cysteine hydrolase family protein [Patulibacter sp.]
MTRALLLIDIQQDYFPGGAFPLVGPEPAAEAAARLLAAFRDADEPVVHVRHAGEPGSGFLVKDTPGAEFHPSVAPTEGEEVVVKGSPNAFLDTDLDARLRHDGVRDLVIAGMMTSMCVDATARTASDLGYRVTVVADACACPDLEHDGRKVPAADVQTAFLAALGSAYGDVAPADQVLAG